MLLCACDCYCICGYTLEVGFGDFMLFMAIDFHG